MNDKQKQRAIATILCGAVILLVLIMKDIAALGQKQTKQEQAAVEDRAFNRGYFQGLIDAGKDAE